MATTKKSPILFFDTDDDIFDFQLMGLQTHATEDYKLSYDFNSTLNFKFQRVSDFSLLQKQEEFLFSIYSYYNENEDINYTLFSNISIRKETQLQQELLFDTATTHSYLFPELRNFSYLLKAESQFNTTILTDLQRVKLLIQFQFINHKNLKNRENLILDS